MASQLEEDSRFDRMAEEDGSEEQEMEDEEEEEEEDLEEEERVRSPEEPAKKKKPGVVYLSTVPDGMNVSQTTGFFSEFGRVGRVFLQPDKTDRQKGKYNRVFSEGWVEFLSKKVARTAAERLNCQAVGGKRKSKAHDQIWNIKYLPRFKWVHLSERLAYEAAVRQQRLRTEISQVKREAEQFKSSVAAAGRRRKKARGEGEAPPAAALQTFTFRQRETEVQVRKRKADEAGTKTEEEAPVGGKRKKTKKSKGPAPPAAAAVPVTVKKKKNAKVGKAKAGARLPKAKAKEGGGERTALLKSVFGGGS